MLKKHSNNHQSNIFLTHLKTANVNSDSKTQKKRIVGTKKNSLAHKLTTSMQ